MYNPSSGKFKKEDVPLNSIYEKIEASSNITSYLEDGRHKIFQISEYGFNYEIFVDPLIDYQPNRDKKL